jgi:hypothetical protein
VVLVSRALPVLANVRHALFGGASRSSLLRGAVTASIASAWMLTFLATSVLGQSESVDVSGSSTSAAAPQATKDRYRDGMVIWETPADARVPFLLKFNINTQLRRSGYMGNTFVRIHG